MTFTATQIEQLRTEFSRINTVHPDRLDDFHRMFDQLDNGALKQFATSGVKFLSKLAVNACVRRGINTDDLIHRRRIVRVTCNDGQSWTTEINGTVDSIRRYYIGQSFEYDETKPMHTAISVEFLDDEPTQPEYVGKFARSIESGWLGKVIGIESCNGETMLKMQGVNTLCHTINGGDIEDYLDDDDFQWFTPEDVVFKSVK